MGRIPIRAAVIFILALPQLATSQNFYQYQLDLRDVPDDRIQISLNVPEGLEDGSFFRFPAVIPGTYQVYDFGRFISEFVAEDDSGNTILSNKIDLNTWQFDSTSKVAKIRYRVDDSWEEQGENHVFEPAGTEIAKGKFFLLNNHGFFGYFDKYENLEIRLTVNKPQGFYASSSLVPFRTSDSLDEFRVPSYSRLVDSPIMYCIPDTTILHVGGAEVLVSVYGGSLEVNSHLVAREIGDILEAQRKYLGGTLPIEKYAFLIYFFEGWSYFGEYGALEHNLSSVYFLPLFLPDMIGETVRQMAAHEFFHIRTPLGIHSKEIHDFKFDSPEMSKHLWLYEGVTEYSALHVQVRYGLISLEDFLFEIMTKIDESSGYNDTVAFTEMSENILGPYQDEFMNVYAKGALLGMCLDIRLRQTTEGKYGLNDLLDDLWKKFGPDRPFHDDSLFLEIEEFSNRDIREFLESYVATGNPVPYAEFLEPAGIRYIPGFEISEFTMGNIDLRMQDDGTLVVESLADMSEFDADMGYRKGDVLVEIGGIPLQNRDAFDVIHDYFAKSEEGDLLEVVAMRKKGKGDKQKRVTLQANLVRITEYKEATMRLLEQPTVELEELLKSWLGEYRRD